MFYTTSDANVFDTSESFERKEIRKIKTVLKRAFPDNVELINLIQALKELHDEEVLMYKYFKNET